MKAQKKLAFWEPLSVRIKGFMRSGGDRGVEKTTSRGTLICKNFFPSRNPKSRGSVIRPEFAVVFDAYLKWSCGAQQPNWRRAKI